MPDKKLPKATSKSASEAATISRLESRLKAGGINRDELVRLLGVLEKSFLVRLMDDTYQLTNEKFSPRIRQWSAEQAALEHARQESIRQIKRVRDSALRGLLAGAIGFSTSRTFNHITADDRPVASRIADWDEVRAIVALERSPLDGQCLTQRGFRFRRSSQVRIGGGHFGKL